VKAANHGLVLQEQKATEHSLAFRRVVNIGIGFLFVAPDTFVVKGLGVTPLLDQKIERRRVVQVVLAFRVFVGGKSEAIDEPAMKQQMQVLLGLALISGHKPDNERSGQYPVPVDHVNDRQRSVCQPTVGYSFGCAPEFRQAVLHGGLVSGE